MQPNSGTNEYHLTFQALSLDLQSADAAVAILCVLKARVLIEWYLFNIKYKNVSTRLWAIPPSSVYQQLTK
jgi:hypothetical protein